MCVNTTRAWRHKNGQVDPAQIERVASAAVTESRDRPNQWRGHRAATRVWAAAGADLVMGGAHSPALHVGIARPGAPMWVVQAGTAVSSRTRPTSANSVNVLSWRDAADASAPDAATADSALPHRTVGLCAARSGLRVRKCHWGAAPSPLMAGPTPVQSAARGGRRGSPSRARPSVFPKQRSQSGCCFFIGIGDTVLPWPDRAVPSSRFQPKAHHAQLSPQQS